MRPRAPTIPGAPPPAATPPDPRSGTAGVPDPRISRAAPAARTSALPRPLSDVREAADELLDTFLLERLEELAGLDPRLLAVGHEILGLVRAGGKRLRPAFVHWGAVAGGVRGETVLPIAAAVELLHSFALVHDDVMDRADRRRGRPTAQASLARRHRDERLDGDADWFGVSAAILAGDLAFVWSDQLLEEAALPTVTMRRIRGVFTQLRTEVTAGQYLDLRLAGSSDASVADALRVALLKSGRYSVTRPLLLGAAAGAADEELTSTLAVYGDAVGVAFQLRDDVIGLFGEPEDTGKDSVADLREGKRTLLVLTALEHADAHGRRELRRLLGAPHVDARDVAVVRDIVHRSGALAEVERRIGSGLLRALDALLNVPEPAASALAELAELATQRSR
jgi:geranylgeranyl diphosphate synthase, type I